MWNPWAKWNGGSTGKRVFHWLVLFGYRKLYSQLLSQWLYPNDFTPMIIPQWYPNDVLINLRVNPIRNIHVDSDQKVATRVTITSIIQRGSKELFCYEQVVGLRVYLWQEIIESRSCSGRFPESLLARSWSLDGQHSIAVLISLLKFPERIFPLVKSHNCGKSPFLVNHPQIYVNFQYVRIFQSLQEQTICSTPDIVVRELTPAPRRT
jgi:hypothetical protein